MTLRSISSALLAVLLAFSGAERCACAQQPDSTPDFRQPLQKLAEHNPDPCGRPYGKDEYPADVESRLFQQASDLVTQSLNTTAGNGSPRDRATDALKKLEAMSAEINASWPEENRLHFQILDFAPALVVKMTMRTHEKFFVFGVPGEDSGKPNQLWRKVGSDGSDSDDPFPVDLYPLHRGPSGNARFLAKSIHSGCAGSIGVSYDAREWNPKTGSLAQIIKQVGSLGLDDKEPGFEWVGELHTEGSVITLPYCWFSPIDTWDNPSLCAVDTYDLSGDDVRFRSRAYNRPDLLPIAKAIEYAQQRDYPAVLGYCNSPDVAHRLVRDVLPSFFAEDVRVTSLGSREERVEIGGYRFDVEKRAGRWRVVAFSTE